MHGQLLVGADGRVRVTDFGLVAARDGLDDVAAAEAAGALTGTGARPGTPRGRLPPESNEARLRGPRRF